MSEELDEQQNALNSDEGQAQEDELDIEALKEKAAKADEYKKYADRVAAENKELKKSTINSPDSERDFIVDLRLEGYSKSEADFILRNGGKSALDDPLVTSAIEAQRNKVKSENATPTGTGKSTVYQKYTEKDLRAMSSEELEKILE